MRFWVALAAVILGAGLLGVEVGMGMGQRSERGAVAGQRIDSVALPALRPQLRCANGPEPRVWTRQEAESKVHLAQVALDTALANSWNPRFRDWTEFAKANMELVKVCWGGEKP